MRGWVVLYLAVGSLFADQSAMARNREISDADFIYFASLLRTSPHVRAQFSANCHVMVLEELSAEEEAKTAKINNMTAEQVIREVCQRMIRGVVSGKLTYRQFAEWLKTPAGETFKMPEYD
jgi:hypothetical protein